MTVEMAQRGAHAATVLNCPGELTGGPARFVAIIVDPFTVLGFEMDFVQRRSRLTTFFRSLLAVRQMVFAIGYGLAFFVVYVMAWFALMFTGRNPARGPGH